MSGEVAAMRFDIRKDLTKLDKEHKRKARWYKVVGVLAVIVLFCTVYALILPAVTLESDKAAENGVFTEGAAAETAEVGAVEAEASADGAAEAGDIYAGETAEDESADEADSTEEAAANEPAGEEAAAEVNEEPAEEQADKTVKEKEDKPAQILTAKVNGATVSVEAGKGVLPAGAVLHVEEIPAGSDEHADYSEQAVKAISGPDAENSAAEAAEKSTGRSDGSDEAYELKIVDVQDVSVNGSARFFDITILSDGAEIEPQAAVDVKIEYAEPLDLAKGEELQVVHFADDGIEVIDPDINGSEITFRQESFSVTGTITTNPNGSNGSYALLAEYEGSMYEVMYDGSLRQIIPNGNGAYTIDMAERWNYRSNNQGAVTYVRTNNGTSYIDPGSDPGISSSSARFTRTAQGNSGGFKISMNGNYLGVTNTGGSLTLSGNNPAGGAAVFYYAQLTQVGSSPYTVDHIDIGVEAVASVQVPLAYGTYYYADGTVAEEVAVGEHKNAVGVNNAIPIAENDLMSARISSYTKDAAGNRTADNSFIISEYTSSTQQGEIDQVRIGGVFPVGEVTLSGNGRRGDIERYIASDDQVYYEVSVSKEVPLTLQKNGQTLYQMDSSGNLVPLTVNVNVQLSSEFSFWDDDNECPGLASSIAYNRNWKQSYYGSYWSPGFSPAGMDFRLGTKDDTDSNVTAIEIIKYIVDENGHTIALSDDESLTYSFGIYNNKNGDVTAPAAWSGATTEEVDYNGYTKLTDRELTVGASGMGVAYDYSVDSGLVYVKEAAPAETITDADGNELSYQGTYIETEYVWRNDGGTTHSNVNQNDLLTAVPDVLGEYYYLDENGNTVSTYYNEETGEDEPLFSTFLEFYVYNVYAPDTTEISVFKEWENADGTTDAPEGASVVFTLLADGESTDYNVTLDGTADTEPTGSGAAGYESTAWTAKFINLPITDPSGAEIVYTVAETRGYPGYKASPNGPVGNGGTITNSQLSAVIKLLKIGDGDTSIKLDGVEFELYSVWNGAGASDNVKAKDVGGQEVGTITTSGGGLAAIGELLPGTYYLVETKTMDGYNILAEPVEIYIRLADGDPGYTVSYNQTGYSASSGAGNISPDTDGAYLITVSNPSGAELPMTGGPGTLIYTLGGMLIMAAALMYGFGNKRAERREYTD